MESRQHSHFGVQEDSLRAVICFRILTLPRSDNLSNKGKGEKWRQSVSTVELKAECFIMTNILSNSCENRAGKIEKGLTSSPWAWLGGMQRGVLGWVWGWFCLIRRFREGPREPQCIQNPRVSCHIPFLMPGTHRQRQRGLLGRTAMHVSGRGPHIGHFKLGTIQMSSTVEWIEKIGIFLQGKRESNREDYTTVTCSKCLALTNTMLNKWKLPDPKE